MSFLFNIFAISLTEPLCEKLLSARERVPISEEKGELCGADYVEFRRECETERNRITWDVEKRCYLPSDARTM